MSPSWAESLQWVLDAGRLRGRRLSRGWRARVLAEAELPLAAATPDAAHQALVQMLPALQGRATRSEVLLCGPWTRLALVDDAAGLRGLAERDAAARHALQRLYGDAEGGWHICHAMAGRHTLLAAGISRALQGPLHSTLAAAGAPLAVLRASFAPALNHCRHRLRQPAWFVWVEAGAATLAYSDGQRLRSLRCHRLQPPLAEALLEALPAWITRSRLIDGLDAQGGPAARQVVIASETALPEPLAAALHSALQTLALAAELVTLPGWAAAATPSTRG